jgi:D-glycero-alpha-D-manno-heptose-7-phosphate kinase
MTVRARAPLRIDFAGGWTDVPAFAEREGGMVVAAAIDRHVEVEVILGGGRIRLFAGDLEQRATYAGSGFIRYDGTLDLHKAALNMLPVTGGIEIASRSDAPAGSGLGASGALDVALLAGLAHCRRETFDAADLAELGFLLETQELKLLGGRQDQLCAALGGFHRFRFDAEGATSSRLEVSSEQSRDLERHTLLVYTGHSHFSSGTHVFVWDRYAAGDAEVTDALRSLRDLADEAAGRVAAADWEGLARVVDRNWSEQQRLHPSIATPRMRTIEDAARAAGAWGLKATGAGAGGCMIAIGPTHRRGAVEAAVTAAGGAVLSYSFSPVGVTVREDADEDHRD